MQSSGIRIAIIGTLAASLGSFGYAQQPVQFTALPLDVLVVDHAAGSILQQDEPKPKETPDAKHSKPDKPEKSAKQQKPEESSKPKVEDQKQDKKVENQKQDKSLAKQAPKEERGQEAKGGRIPDKDFNAHFGHGHDFSARRVVATTRIVPNQTQFVYSGYTFVFVDPWPAGWAVDDDCYIDYVGGGYYLFDVVHPGVRIALTIVG